MKRFLTLVLAAAFALFSCGCAEKNAYEAATALMAAGDYAGAQAAFAALADYKDSAAQATECAYRLAYAELETGDLAAARLSFAALGSYKNSAEVVDYCAEQLRLEAEYAAAVAEFERGEFETALELFRPLGEYRDAALYAAKCVNELGFNVSYRGKSYHAVPEGWGEDQHGRLTLTLLITEPIALEVGELYGVPLGMSVPPFGAAVAVAGVEYPAQDYLLEAGACRFVFGVSGTPTHFVLSEFMLTEAGAGTQQLFDAAALPYLGMQPF